MLEQEIFSGRSDYSEHLAKHHAVDLMLDTFPFNGGTTTSDALWCGTPVLTLCGNSFASRMGASLLNNIGLDELITTSIENYTSKAIYLASHTSVLDALRGKLLEDIKSSPLFDTQRYARNFEKGLEMAVLRSRSGLAPDNIVVPKDIT